MPDQNNQPGQIFTDTPSSDTPITAGTDMAEKKIEDIQSEISKLNQTIEGMTSSLSSSQPPLQTPVNTVTAPYPAASSSVSSEPPIEVPPSSSGSVIVTSGSGTPKWFFILFGLTLVLFIIVTAFLVMTLLNKKKDEDKQTAIAPDSVPSVTAVPKLSPTLFPISPTVTLLPPEASDSTVIKMDTLSNSDEISQIENDIQNTDLSFIDTGLENLDKQIGFTPEATE